MWLLGEMSEIVHGRAKAPQLEKLSKEVTLNGALLQKHKYREHTGGKRWWSRVAPTRTTSKKD